MICLLLNNKRTSGDVRLCPLASDMAIYNFRSTTDTLKGLIHVTAENSRKNHAYQVAIYNFRSTTDTLQALLHVTVVFSLPKSSRLIKLYQKRYGRLYQKRYNCSFKKSSIGEFMHSGHIDPSRGLQSTWNSSRIDLPISNSSLSRGPNH